MLTKIQRLHSRLEAFFNMPFHDKLNVVRCKICLIKGRLYYRHVFGSFGRTSMLFRPMFLSNPRFIHIGTRVTIRQGARIEAVISNARRIPCLSIGDNVNIEQNVHLVCHSRLIIGKDVSIAGNCGIVDVTHPYFDVHNSVKIGARILDDDSFVEIGDGCFIGFASLVMPGVRIGKYCVIGAHSVVTKDVPDYSVAVGTPAKVIRYYSVTTERWLTP